MQCNVSASCNIEKIFPRHPRSSVPPFLIFPFSFLIAFHPAHPVHPACPALRGTLTVTSSEAIAPMPVMTGGMQNRKDNDGVVSNDEKNAIRKSPRENPPDFRFSAQQAIERRILNRPLDGCPNFKRQFQSQARHSPFIPKRGIVEVCLGFRPDNQAAPHAFSRARMRFSTSSHELPASGSAS